jgi:hypothetical protein
VHIDPQPVDKSLNRGMSASVEELRLRKSLPTLTRANPGAEREGEEVDHAAFPVQQSSHLLRGDDGVTSLSPFWGTFK